jgi:transposase
MDTINLPYLLLNTRLFIIEEIQTEEHELCLTLESTAVQGTCPKCDQESSQLHSTYLRYPLDLPWAEWPVRLHLRAKRFFCRNRKCPKKTFAERFPDFLARYARRTDRVRQKQQRLGVNVCARTAEKLLKLDQVGISDTTVNRLLLHLPEPEQPPVRVLGVDDWAKRKGQRYGTILVDLERGQIVDLLGERTAEPLVKWLEDHPGIEIVSRDRSQTYGDAIRRGASEAIQVADRWHLLKNASEVIFKILQQEYAAIRNLLNPEPKTIKTDDHQAKVEDQAEDFTVAEQRRKDRIDLVRELHGRGYSQKEIARQIHMHPKTIRRYLRAPIPTRRSHRKKRLLDPYHPYLLKRWNEGCHNATQLWREIQSQGFEGQLTIVLTLIQQFRKARGLPPNVRHLAGKALDADSIRQPPALRTLSYWILKRPENRKEEQEKLVEQIRAAQPKLDATLALAREFASMIRGRKAEELDPWLEKAEQSGYRVWNNFVAGLKQDYAAVRAALSYSWSNGPTEGHINRLKCLKRLMYGRAKDDLLRKRVLWQGRWGFT